jgi:dihydroorotate dehydrogenase (fumarate)
MLTTYVAGLELAHPFVAGSSPLCFEVDSAKELERYGAAAIIMPSLITATAAVDHPPAFSRNRYLERLAQLRQALRIPVFASVHYHDVAQTLADCQTLADAGAQAIEINIYRFYSDDEHSSQRQERELDDLLVALKKALRVPVFYKISPYYTGLPYLVARLEALGLDGLTLFNRFYHPDIDIEQRRLLSHYQLSERTELPLRLYWLAVLSSQRRIPLACSGGVHQLEDSIRALMAGATVVQITSAALSEGPQVFEHHLHGLEQWITSHDCRAIDELRGCMNINRCPEPALYTDVNHINALFSWWQQQAEK